MPSPKPSRAAAVDAAKSGRASRADVAVRLRPATAGHEAAAVSISVAPKTLAALASRQANVKVLMETLGRTIEHSRRSGQPGGFTVEVDATGNPRISPFRPPPPANQQLGRALEAARGRGRARVAEILSGKEMLTADEFVRLLGTSRVTVNLRRRRYEALALEGAKRGFRFPAWQVDDGGKPFAALPKLFELLGGNPWTVYRFLVQRHAALDGATARDALLAGRAAQVLEAAESLAQGASA